MVIRNPASRHTLGDARLEQTLQIARDAGWRVECRATEHEGHATAIAREAAASGADVILVAGGDGTINEAINGFAGSKNDIALAVLPGGTANVWAKETHVPRDPLAAMRAIVHGERRRVDLGRAGYRYFLLMAGIGLDARIIPGVSAGMKRRFGATAYLLKGVRVALKIKAPIATWRVDGAEHNGSMYWMLIGNTRSYGGLIDIMHRAEADDGLFDTAVMHRGGAWHLLADGARLLLKQHDRSPNIDFARARSIEIDTPGLPVQLDGEYAGTSPMRFEIVPRALTVIVPPGLRTPLLRNEA
ncbi:MAG: diacylglycerol kinase family lipid kinase [Chloroflexota bacterium]|nr:diacylglycerol kinase family lipid kinase [Chloroflexota bacterium]